MVPEVGMTGFVGMLLGCFVQKPLLFVANVGSKEGKEVKREMEKGGRAVAQEVLYSFSPFYPYFGRGRRCKVSFWRNKVG